MASVTQLPQNYVPEVGLQVNLDFMRYLKKQGVDASNELAVTRTWGQYVQEAAGQNNNIGQYMRAYGEVAPRSSDYKLYENGPFSWQAEDVISDVITAGSDTLQWIPTVSISDGAKKEAIPHLEWTAPRGWDGSAYSTWLAGLDIADCDYGPTPKWNGFEYEITAGQMSWKSDTFNRLKDLALPYDYRRSPHFFQRGPNAGLPLNNDVDFNVALVAQNALSHLDYVVSFGNISNQPMMEWDGLDTILTASYVSSHLVSGSTGTPSGYASPIIYNGAGLANIAALINVVRRGVRALRNRASKRKLAVAQNDMAIRLPMTLWSEIADYLAVNGQIAGISYTEQPAAAEERANRILASKQWNIDGQNVAILIDDNDVAISGSTVTTDIQILTRRAGGINLIEQQYVDFSTLRVPAGLEGELTTGLNGIMRYGWIEENKKCFYYFVEMLGRLVVRSLPNQMVIENYSYTLDTVDEIEGTAFTDSYYPNYGTPGSIGAGAQ